MPCQDAVIKKIISLKPEQTVRDAMAMFDQHQIRAMPVIDSDNRLLGMFSTGVLVHRLLPVSATMQDGLKRLGFIVGATPGAAKKLKAIMNDPVEKHMDRDAVVVHPDTSFWEGLRLLAQYGSPLPVVEENTGKLFGIMTDQSAIHELLNIIDNTSEEEFAEI